MFFVWLFVCLLLLYFFYAIGIMMANNGYLDLFFKDWLSWQSILNNVKNVKVTENVKKMEW